MSDDRPNNTRAMAVLLGAIVSLFTIVATILGVGWKLGSIASGIETQIVEVKGEMRTLNAISGERINGIERRLSEIEQAIKESKK
jgi:cell division septal protein FtsQ